MTPPKTFTERTSRTPSMITLSNVKSRFYRFVWSRNFGEKLAIPKGSIVEALAFGKLRSVLVRWKGKFYITDRYALRKLEGS